MKRDKMKPEESNVADNSREERDSKKGSKYLNADEQQGNHPGADRAAKTERKGAGQQQGSSGHPINS